MKKFHENVCVRGVKCILRLIKMHSNLIVKKIFAETLNFLIISSIGYPYSGCQTNDINTSKEFLTSTTAFYTTIASLNHLKRTSSMDTKLSNDSNHLKMISHFAKEDHSRKLLNNQHIPDAVLDHSTERTVFNNSRELLMFNSSADLVTPTKTTTSASVIQKLSLNISTIRPAPTKPDNKSTLPKFQKTDAPMLNYIFDMFSTANKHHHHDQRYGPHFEDILKAGTSNITVQAGGSVYLNCRISLLQDKTVSWVRRNTMGEDALELLTVGLHTYTGDKRYTMEFQYPNNWRLKITSAKKEDEATYECQISTHPPRVIQIHLSVNAPKVMIVDEYNIPLQEKYYEIDSTLQLTCTVRNVVMTSSVVYWRHGDQILNYDTTRGGVSVRTDLMEDGANSSLSIARVNKQDSGNYTCSISDSQDYTILVHILKGESFAELHHGDGVRICDDFSILITMITLSLILNNTNNTLR